jgi:uncharacterized oxidoreductase
MKFTGHTVLITGGTSGIGLELAKQLMRRQNTVVVTGRDQSRLQRASAELPGLHVIQSDVSDVGSIQALHQQVIAKFPGLDMLFNNAGEMRTINFNQDHDLSDLTREIEINLCGPMRMAQQFIPHLKTKSQAWIVNVSSGLAFVPFPVSPVYCATKAGLHSFSQSLRKQLAETNINVIELAPPGVDTPLYRNLLADRRGVPKGMDVVKLGEETIKALESGHVEIRPGLSNVLKLLSRLAPEFALAQLEKSCRPTGGWVNPRA